MKKHLLSTVAMLAMTAAATAADLPRRDPPPYIPPPPPPMWTGPFVGVHLGFGWGDPSNDPDDKVLISGFGNNYGAVAIGSRDKGSLTGGAQLGYNLQLTPTFLVGVVADFTWLGRDYAASGITSSPVIGTNWTETATFTSSLKHDWLGTARVRAGVTFDNLLLYATGGLAFGEVDSRSSSRTTYSVPGGPTSVLVASGSGSSSDMEFGWTIGGGLEYRLSPSWSLFAEYLYYSLSSRYTVNVTPGPTIAALPTSYRVKADADGHLVKFGINYAFWTY